MSIVILQADSTMRIIDPTRIENFFKINKGVTPEVWENVAIDGAILLGICVAVWIISRWVAKVLMKSISGKTKTEFDDHLMKYNFFKCTLKGTCYFKMFF